MPFQFFMDIVASDLELLRLRLLWPTQELPATLVQ